MKNLKVIVTTLIIGISVIGMSASFSFRKNRNKNKTNTSKPAPTVGMANPASVYCEKQGGKSIIVKGSKGEYGVCQLKDGTTIEEWEYYRQNNTPQSFEAEIITGSPNPASKFCVDKGGNKKMCVNLKMVHKLTNGIITDKITNNLKLYNTIYKDGKFFNLSFFITYYF